MDLLFFGAVNVLNYHDEGDFNHDKAAFNAYEVGNRGGPMSMEDALRDVMSVATLEAPAELPLWRAEANKAAAEWATVCADWKEPGSPFRFWARWYQSALDGFPLPSAMQRDIALIEDADWQAGPARVAERIEDIEVRFYSLDKPVLTPAESVERRLADLPEARPDEIALARTALLRHRAELPATFDAITGFIALEIERLQNRNYTSDEDRDLCLQQIGVLKTIHVATESLRAAIPADPKVEPDAEKIESLGRVYINLFKEWPRSNAPELVDSTCRLALVGVSVPMLTFIGVSAITAVACALVAFGGKKLLETAKLAKDVLVPGKADT